VLVVEVVAASEGEVPALIAPTSAMDEEAALPAEAAEVAALPAEVVVEEPLPPMAVTLEIVPEALGDVVAGGDTVVDGMDRVSVIMTVTVTVSIGSEVG